MTDMFPTWQILLACYGVCYIVMNKVDGALRPVASEMVDCAFCSGVVSGTVVWTLMWLLALSTDYLEDGLIFVGHPGGWGYTGTFLQICLWGLVSGATCAIVDPVVKFFEESSGAR